MKALLLLITTVFAFAQTSHAIPWDGYDVVRKAHFLKESALELDRTARNDKSLSADLQGTVHNFTEMSKFYENYVTYNHDSAAQSAKQFNDLHDLFHAVMDGFGELEPGSTYDVLIDNAHRHMHGLHRYYK